MSYLRLWSEVAIYSETGFGRANWAASAVGRVAVSAISHTHIVHLNL